MAFETIADFQNIHEGKRLFVLASGPSLSDLDLSPLQRRIVMGLNRSFLAYPDTHYHCCMDKRLFELYPALFEKTRYLFNIEGWSTGIPLQLLGSEGFSDDLTDGIYSGYTISYFALQVAQYMGFTEVVYLGLDLANAQGQTHFFGTDFCSRNHEETEFPKMARMLESGVRKMQERGMKVYNCSPVCALDCFTRISFEEAVAL